MGSCLYEDEDFLADIEELIKENGIDKDINIMCNINIKDDICPYCGNKLHIHIDTVEYWGAKVPMPTWYCPNGC